VAVGTLHPRQVLGGSLPLLSPAFRCSHFRRHVPLRPRSVYCILILCAGGCVMAQVVSWQPFNWRQLRLNDRPVHVGFVADSGIGTGF